MRYKRYFPVSHDINRDPEIVELKSRYGLPGFCLWLEILSITDRTDGQLKVSSYWLRTVCKLVGNRVSNGFLVLNYFISKGWLLPNNSFKDGLEVTYTVANYAEYHKKRSTKSDKLETQTEQFGPPPNLPTFPSLPNHPKETHLKKDEQRKSVGPDGPNTQKSDYHSAEKPESVSEQVWRDFLKQRKAKKAPVTDTVLCRMAMEARKAEKSLEEAMAICCQRGWQGFEARYVADQQQGLSKDQQRVNRLKASTAEILETLEDD